jgi:hypothetical protein
MKHPHAWVLRAIADGEPPSNFECLSSKWRDQTWEIADDFSAWIYDPGTNWQVRRKQKTIKVNGFDVPEPVLEPLGRGTEYFFASVSNLEFAGSARWWGEEDKVDFIWLSRGLIHLKKENAIAHAKAMLGIDPNT